MMLDDARSMVHDSSGYRGILENSVKVSFFSPSATLVSSLNLDNPTGI